MNTPSPLQPLGRLPQSGSGRPGFSIAVITIVAFHAVFFGGLLLQGCKRNATDTTGLETVPPTNNSPVPDSLAGLGQAYPEPTNFGSFTGQPPGMTITSPPPAEPTNFLVGNQPLSNAPGTTDQMGTTGSTGTVGGAEATPPAGATTEYKIVKGDTLSKIARKSGVSLDALREANPNLNERRLQIGQPLTIPAKTREMAAATPGAAAATGTVYVVKAGDTLSKIGRLYGTTAKELRSFNGLKTDRIVPSQKIKIPPGKSASGTEAKPEAAPPKI